VYICANKTTSDMKNSTKNLVMTKSGQVSKNITNALARCSFAHSTKKIYTGYYLGSGRFASRHSAMHTVTAILNAQGYAFEMGNDAAKGGAYGEYVQLKSRTAFEFVQNLKNA